MNIFYLDDNPQIAAEMHCDKHVVKMLVEYAQLMSTAHRVTDCLPIVSKSKTGRKVTRYILREPELENILYKACHVNHPSAIWARESKQNYSWLLNLWLCLHNEYKSRYKKEHKSYTLLRYYLCEIPQGTASGEFSEPPQCMPDDVKTDDTIEAYRDYYRVHKSSFATWKNRRPEWYGK